MSTTTPPRTGTSGAATPRVEAVDRPSATRVLAGTATVYLCDGRDDYVVRAPGDVDAVSIGVDHAATLTESFPTEEVPLSSTPAWPTLTEQEFVRGQP